MPKINVTYPNKDRISIKYENNCVSIYMNEDTKFWGETGIHMWMHGDVSEKMLDKLVSAIDESPKKEEILEFLKKATIYLIPPEEVEDKRGLIVDKDSKAFARAKGLI